MKNTEWANEVYAEERYKDGKKELTLYFFEWENKDGNYNSRSIEGLAEIIIKHTLQGSKIRNSNFSEELQASWIDKRSNLQRPLNSKELEELAVELSKKL